ncbi:hypothetical protein ANN_17930 [Periplaneta americana]|uniref:Uncharacterized protein n=1 Tax=Periplaneta americana TaxID=6978 RepID=A0ABQ8SNK3_PERAM|nr:hypothetical protein ANN_17930 [Periplaneta americana]
MNPGSSTESYPAFARIGLRENPGKNLNQVTCPDRESNPGLLVSRPDALTVTPQWVVVGVGGGGGGSGGGGGGDGGGGGGSSSSSSSSSSNNLLSITQELRHDNV